jgi:hypothetical protein
LTKIDNITFSKSNQQFISLSTNTVSWIEKESRDFFGSIKFDYLKRALCEKSTSFLYFYLYKKFGKNKTTTSFKRIEEQCSSSPDQHSCVKLTLTDDGNSNGNIKSKIGDWFKRKPVDDDKNSSKLKALLNPEDQIEFEELDQLSLDFETIIQRYNTTVKTIAGISKSRLATFFEMVSSILIKNDLTQITKLGNFLGTFKNKRNFIQKLQNFNLKTKTTTTTSLLENSDDKQPTTTSSPRLDDIKVNSKVSKVYKLINEASGAIGGNSSHGPIYGEQTMGSFQNVINYLKSHCEFNNDSRFVDVGSGLGKPNFHVAQDPMVKLSIGIELHDVRFQVITLVLL